MNNLDSKMNALQQEMVEKAKETLFSHFSALLTDDITFIEWQQNPDVYDDNEYQFEIEWVVATNEEQVKLILEEHSEKMEWHSDVIELIAWEELLNRKSDKDFGRNIMYDLNRIQGVLALMGEARIKITKEKIEVR